jgi:uncharacterized caspase-like protein
MAKNRAIIIGINQYRFMQPLKYAKRDAELFFDFLSQEAGFHKEHVFLFTDDSLPVESKTTEPFRANLMRVLRQFSEQLSDRPSEKGDSFWFFFSGHGIRYGDRDYLMPLDGDPDNINSTGISTYDITDCLRRCNSDNIVLILDACRSQGRKGEGIGRQTEAKLREAGIITIFSCNPNQASYEIESLQQGAFTVALLEGLGDQGRCATVEQLNQYLKNRVPEVVNQHHTSRAKQDPYVIAEPIERARMILMPKHATSSDISALKNNAHRAEDIEYLNQDEQLRSLTLAEQLWLQINTVALGKDDDAIRAIQRITAKRIHLQESKTILDGDTLPRKLSNHVMRGLGSDYAETWQGSRVSIIKTEPPSCLVSDSEEDLSLQIDCSMLVSMLSAQRWKDADIETYRLILKVVGKETENWFAAKDQSKLPRAVVILINQLWVEKSNYKFGFSIQQQVWCSDEVGGQIARFDRAVFRKFGDRVGWRRNNDWLPGYDEFEFTLSAKAGHLPSFGFATQRWDRWKDSFQNLFPYICICLQSGNSNL